MSATNFIQFKSILPNVGRRKKIFRNNSGYFLFFSVSNFSLSALLSNDALLVMVYGLEQHIPVKLKKHTIKTKFKLFNENLLKNV